MSYLEMENQFRIKTNDARYSYQVGLLYASCFGYSEMTKSLIRNINKRGAVWVDNAKVDKPANSYETYSCKIPNTDYYHTIVIRNDKVEKDETGDKSISLCSDAERMGVISSQKNP